MKKVAILFVVLCLIMQNSMVVAAPFGLPGSGGVRSGSMSNLNNQKTSSGTSQKTGSLSNLQGKVLDAGGKGGQRVSKPNNARMSAKKESKKGTTKSVKLLAKKQCNKQAKSDLIKKIGDMSAKSGKSIQTKKSY